MYLKPNKVTPTITVSQFLEVLAEKTASEQLAGYSHKGVCE